MDFFSRSEAPTNATSAEDSGPGPAPRQFPPPIRRTWFASGWDAWRAVTAGVGLHEYLRYRLAHYRKEEPQDRYPRRCTVTVENGQIVEETAGENDPPAGDNDPLEAEIRWLRASQGTESRQVTADLAEKEAEIERLTARIQAAGGEVEDRKTELSQAISSGRAACERTEARSPNDRGRPADPSHWGPTACYVFIVLALLGEAYQFAIPYLSWIGIDPKSLGAELRRDPTGLFSGFLFAGAVSASLFVLFQWIFEISRQTGRPEGRRGGWRAGLTPELALAIGLSGLAILMAFLISGMRHDGAEASSTLLAALDRQPSAEGGEVQGAGGRWLFFVLTLAVPVVCAFVSEKARGLAEAHHAVREAQLVWDAAREAPRQERERREEIAATAEGELAWLRAERALARERVKEITAEERAAEQDIRRVIDARRRYGVAFTRSLVAALEQDRYHFIQAARRRGAASLLLEASSPRPPIGVPGILALLPGRQQCGCVVGKTRRFGDPSRAR